MESNWMRPRSKGECTTVGYRKVADFACLINITLCIASISIRDSKHSRRVSAANCDS